MDKSDWKKLGLGGLGGLVIAADINVDVVELLEFIKEQSILFPMFSEAHQAFASGGNIVIEVPSTHLTFSSSAPEVSISSSSTG